MRIPGSAEKRSAQPFFVPSYLTLFCSFFPCVFAPLILCQGRLPPTHAHTQHRHARAFARANGRSPKYFPGEPLYSKSGSGRMRLFFEPASGRTLVLPPGAVLGNLSIPRYHGVEHLPADLAEPLCRAGDAAEGFHITIMVRCDAFRANKARGRGTPSPIEVRGHPERSRTPHPPHQVSGAPKSPKSGFPPNRKYVRTDGRKS